MPHILDNLRTAPDKLADRREQLRDRVRALRLEGEERWFNLRLDTLERVEDLLERTDELPVVSLVTGPAERLVRQRIDAVSTPPIDDYDDLNVGEVGEAMRGLPWVDLLKVRRYEEAHKDRKTVYRHLDRELRRRQDIPQAA